MEKQYNLRMEKKLFSLIVVLKKWHKWLLFVSLFWYHDILFDTSLAVCFYVEVLVNNTFL